MTDITITFAALSDVGLTRSINEDAFQLTDLSTGTSFDASPSNGQFKVGQRGALMPGYIPVHVKKAHHRA